MTNSNKKQTKITKLFRKQGAQLPEDCEELEEEIRELEQRLKEKQDELFEAQRSTLKRKVLRAPSRQNEEAIVRPEKIMLHNDINHLERSLELLTILTGTEVKSYVADDHCVIKYHMQHPSDIEIRHGLRINMRTGKNTISKFSLPIGFDFNAVVAEFDNIMTPECLAAVRSALVAYYDRQMQIDALTKLASSDLQLFKASGGTQVELALRVAAPDEPPVGVALQLDYRVYDVRPKCYAFSEIDLPDGVAEILKEQCAVFKRKPLEQAFREAFIDGDGVYKFVQQLEPPPRPSRRGRRRARAYRDPREDHTFRPEDCSSASDDDERGLREAFAR